MRILSCLLSCDVIQSFRIKLIFVFVFCTIVVCRFLSTDVCSLFLADCSYYNWIHSQGDNTCDCDCYAILITHYYYIDYYLYCIIIRRHRYCIVYLSFNNSSLSQRCRLSVHVATAVTLRLTHANTHLSVCLTVILIIIIIKLPWRPVVTDNTHMQLLY